uniref:IPT/TIG domain-containing protein n=1 Tax=Tetraselmis sp. GSL018 TaxID=582737 RepID=A0A061QYQ2_9CHLO|mmetsp:Transcript_19258/g.45908  ORF Transcript_19258/g.45908 Transcript_19258/m.45908 type:complete len:411 (+) Transcript_19258:345-1577(+)
MQGTVVVLLLFRVFPLALATEIRWLSPERGPIRGKTAVYVKGVDFKNSGVTPVACRFHKLEVPAQVISSTLLRCATPAIAKPAEVEVVVLDSSGNSLPGAQLRYQYFECDAQTCYVGDFVATGEPLGPSDVADESPQDSPDEISQEEETDGVSGRELSGHPPGFGLSLQEPPADEVKVPPLQKDAPSWREGEPLRVAIDTVSGDEPEGETMAAMDDGDSSAAPDDVQGDGADRLGSTELGWFGASSGPSPPEEEELGGPTDGSVASRLIAAIVGGLIGAYALRLLRAAAHGRRPETLPATEASGQRDLRHLDPGSSETTIDAEPSSTTSRTLAHDKADRLRPNKRGVRRRASLIHGLLEPRRPPLLPETRPAGLPSPRNPSPLCLAAAVTFPAMLRHLQLCLGPCFPYHR